MLNEREKARKIEEGLFEHLIKMVVPFRENSSEWRQGHNGMGLNSANTGSVTDVLSVSCLLVIERLMAEEELSHKFQP